MLSKEKRFGDILPIKGKRYLAGLVILGLLSSINYFFFSEDPDNVVEQVEELVIKSITGIDIDLSPTENMEFLE